MPSLAVAEGFAYVATACPSHPFDLYEKVRRGFDAEGNAVITNAIDDAPQMFFKVDEAAAPQRRYPLSDRTVLVRADAYRSRDQPLGRVVALVSLRWRARVGAAARR